MPWLPDDQIRESLSLFGIPEFEHPRLIALFDQIKAYQREHGVEPFGSGECDDLYRQIGAIVNEHIGPL